MKKFLLITLMLTLTMFLSINTVFADGESTTNEEVTYDEGTVNTDIIDDGEDTVVEESTTNEEAVNEEESTIIDEISDIDSKEAIAHITKKGYEVVEMLQKIAHPIIIVMFMLSGFLIISGIFGNSVLIGRGLLGLAICIVVYAGILYAPELLDSGVTWIKE